MYSIIWQSLWQSPTSLIIQQKGPMFRAEAAEGEENFGSASGIPNKKYLFTELKQGGEGISK